MDRNNDRGHLSQDNLHLDKTATQNEAILEGIIRDMSDGVIVLGLDGRVRYTNPAASSILGMRPEDLKDRNIASAFFKYEENDFFSQTILNAVYDPGKQHHDLVPYYTGTEFRQLHVKTSALMIKGWKRGIIMILSDITELSSLRIRYAQQVTALLDSLVKALSTAIDERSHYTAHHTRNMVKMGTAFLDWLDRADSSLKFDEERRRCFLMSIWLHDVGKLTVPLEVMDKATRLGEHMDSILQRLDRIHLLDRIAFLEGELTAEELQEREEGRAGLLADIRRIDTSPFLGDDDLSYVGEIARLRYREEDGSEHPVLTDEEILCLQIRKGTLTDAERGIMQSHVEMTRKILESVDFPEDFVSVPLWAAGHHELLDGSGYPDHLRGGDIPTEVRLLTILDIFEALTARDRPYKKPIPLERSLQILRSMVDEGCIDGDLLALFEESRAWEILQ